MDLAPDERFARAAARRRRPRLAEFEQGLAFALDDFQRRACEALEDGAGVLVAAPTGAGKTVVGEFAVHLALARGRRCVYTTPIKALSNQKYVDLVALHGRARVGLLTGDTTVNAGAAVVVATTEVLRNMLYAHADAADDLDAVVLDEVHFLADRERGAVWEEIVLSLPASVQVVGLSATVSNVEELGAWLQSVRGETSVVVDEHRPVPLWQHVLAGRRLVDLYDADREGRPRLNVELVQLEREQQRAAPAGGRGRDGRGRGSGRRARSRGGPPVRLRTRLNPVPRAEVVDVLERADLLPAVVFVFSRAGCDAAVAQCVASGVRLLEPEERDEVRRVAARRTAHVGEADLPALGWDEWLDGLERGVAAHHAGMLPSFRETVEELVVAGLVRVVYATETLALGVNLPARSVVLEKLVKWDGSEHVDLTPGQFTQLTGRAGRRGIDVEGHAVVVWQPPHFDPPAVAALAGSRTFALRSAFRPSYSMVVNLVARLGREATWALLDRSFAQFQADAETAGLARRAQRLEQAAAGARRAGACHLGDAQEYAALRRRLSDAESSHGRRTAAGPRAAAAASLARLAVGDVVALPSSLGGTGGGRHGHAAVVVDPGTARLAEAHPLVVSERRWSGRLSADDLDGPVDVLGTVTVAPGSHPSDARTRRRLAEQLRPFVGAARARRPADPADDEADQLRREVRRHPVHGCADAAEHLRSAGRAATDEAEAARLRAQVSRRTGRLARTARDVAAVLTALGYLDGDRSTARGRALARLHGESDLLVAECLRDGAWDHLDAAGLAAVVSALVHSPRGDAEAEVRLPGAGVPEALEATARVHGRLVALETDHGLAPTRAPEPGLAWVVHRWARGARLATVLADAGDRLSAGDFVRQTKQVLDLLGQVADAAGDGSPVRARAAEADALLRRGVVAHTGLEADTLARG